MGFHARLRKERKMRCADESGRRYRLRVTLRYGDDIADCIVRDLFFEFAERAEETARKILRALPSAEIALVEESEKLCRSWGGRK